MEAITTTTDYATGTPLPTAVPISTLFSQIPETFTFLGHEYTVRQCLRMVVILGGYILIRPLLLKLAGKAQERAHAQQIEDDKLEDSAMASGRQIPGEEPAGAEEDSGWGKSARRRERERLRKIEERLRLEQEDSDEELEGLLDQSAPPEK